MEPIDTVIKMRNLELKIWRIGSIDWKITSKSKLYIQYKNFTDEKFKELVILGNGLCDLHQLKKFVFTIRNYREHEYDIMSNDAWFTLSCIIFSALFPVHKDNSKRALEKLIKYLDCKSVPAIPREVNRNFVHFDKVSPMDYMNNSIKPLIKSFNV